jgi:N-carbamoylputrescine amidase
MEIGHLRIGLIQMVCAREPAANLEKAAALIEHAADDGAQIVCLQELYRSWYPCQSEDNGHFDLAETIPGPSSESLGKLAAAHKVAIIVPIFERRAPGIYHNSALVLDSSGTIAGLYRKMHIPDDPGYYEKFYFAPGDLDFISHRTDNADIGVLICWDQWFPEGARLTALQGAQILFYPTAIGWHPSEKEQYGKAQHESWELIQRSHAVANGCYVCAPNRIGLEKILGADGKPVHDDGIQFWGQSFVAAPNGQIVQRASVEKEEVMVIPADLEQVEFSRTHWPFLRDRRIDAYAPIAQRFLDTE